MSATEIDNATEIKAVALLARGDTHQSIADALGISTSTVGKIKQRNQETLASVRGELIKHETRKAKRLLDRTHKLIEDKLDEFEDVNNRRAKYDKMLDDEEITSAEYARLIRTLPTPSLSELTSLAREMFSQSQIEDGKPTSIPGGSGGGSSKEAQEQLSALLTQLKDGDEVELIRIMSNSKN